MYEGRAEARKKKVMGKTDAPQFQRASGVKKNERDRPPACPFFRRDDLEKIRLSINLGREKEELSIMSRLRAPSTYDKCWKRQLAGGKRWFH